MLDVDKLLQEHKEMLHMLTVMTTIQDRETWIGAIRNWLNKREAAIAAATAQAEDGVGKAIGQAVEDANGAS